MPFASVASCVADTLPAGAEIRHLIDAISAGNFAAAEAGGIPVVTARAALTQGFGWVTLYGTIAPLALGLAAAIAFGRRKPALALQDEKRSGANDTQPALTSAD